MGGEQGIVDHQSAGGEWLQMDQPTKWINQQNGSFHMKKSVSVYL